jgi:hypothetical protein
MSAIRSLSREDRAWRGWPNSVANDPERPCERSVKPTKSPWQAAASIVPNALTAPAFVHPKGFASARVKHYLNDVGPITAANALELFLSLFAGWLASTKKVHVMLLMGIPIGQWNLIPQNWLNSEYFVARS